MLNVNLDVNRLTLKIVPPQLNHTFRMLFLNLLFPNRCLFLEPAAPPWLQAQAHGGRSPLLRRQLRQLWIRVRLHFNSYWNWNFAVTPHVRLSVGWSVSHNFLTFPAPIGALAYLFILVIFQHTYMLYFSFSHNLGHLLSMCYGYLLSSYLSV